MDEPAPAPDLLERTPGAADLESTRAHVHRMLAVLRSIRDPEARERAAVALEVELSAGAARAREIGGAAHWDQRSAAPESVPSTSRAPWA